eukprot:TRINITY_DN10572_c0_g1_i1.p1 TRINITY_DN10572_c0_g1~~TRINITY_DN10572_c0_g1_i1.p1  ORF type:complete len:446 (+),score=29.09 TRINITY_DN10572_c0_g1_i1:146-1339(+)
MCYLAMKRWRGLGLYPQRSSIKSDDSLAGIWGHVENLHKLDLSNCKHITDRTVENIGKYCPNLFLISFFYCPEITDNGVAALMLDNPNVSKLTYLNFQNCKKISDQTALVLSNYCTQLLYLNLRGTNITDKSIIHISEKCSSLRDLSLGSCYHITDHGVQTIAKLEYLETLCLSDCGSVTNYSMERVIRQCRNLRMLDLCKTHVNDFTILTIHSFSSKLQILDVTGAISLANGPLITLIQKTPLLRIINLSFCTRVRDSVLHELGTHSMHLQKLSINGCRLVSDVGVRSLTNCKEINEIQMSGVLGVSDYSILELLESCEYLEIINLSQCPKITDITVHALSKGSQLPRLRSVNFSQCQLVTEASVKQLREVAPSSAAIKYKVFLPPQILKHNERKT